MMIWLINSAKLASNVANYTGVIMLNSSVLKDLSNKINGLIKDSPIADMENNINALIKGAFTKMELVSREEYDVQTKVLQNTRVQLLQLEEKLKALELQIFKK